MCGKMLGRVLALLLGAAAGAVLMMLAMPVRLDGNWLWVDRVAYRGDRSPCVGDRVLIETVVFTENGDGGRIARRVCAVDGDLLYVLCDEGQEGLDSRSEAVGLIPKDQVWGRVMYERKENSHGTEKAPGEQ